MSDRSHVSVDKTVQHIIIGWANEDGTVKSIENEPPALISPVESSSKFDKGKNSRILKHSTKFETL